MHPRVTAAFGVTVVLVGVAGVLAVTGREEATPDPAGIASKHSLASTAASRVVVVSRTMPKPSASARRLSAMLEEGRLPDGPVMAKVMTDTDCTPDDQMVSRCRNVVHLADGRQVVLRHPHNMNDVPCLAPGERVRLIPSQA